MASRVVPGMSDTIIRSWPRSALSRLDLPTFGRPTSAIAGGSSSDSLAIIASHLRADFVVDARCRGVVVGLVAVVELLVADDHRLEPALLDLPGELVGLDLTPFPRELRLGFRRECQHDLVEQVRDAAPVDRGDREGVLPAERVELGGLELPPRVVALVDRDEHRRLRSPEQRGGLLVGGRQPGDRLDDEHDDVGLGDRDARLVLDARLDRVARVDLEAARVDEHEPPPVPVGQAVQPIAGRPGPILDDRRPLADDPVEQGATSRHSGRPTMATIGSEPSPAIGRRA